MNTTIRFRNYILFALLACCLPATSQYFKLQAQTPGQIQKAEATLQTMTPEQIDAKIKELGMTREQAEDKAKEYGIDLNTYLMKGSAPAVNQQQPTVNINVAPQTVTPAQIVPTAQPQAGQAVQPVTPAQTVPTQATPEEAPGPQKPAKEAKPILGPGGIPYFGYNLFKGGPNAFESQPNIADNTYIVGKGDVLRIALWGDVQSMSEYQVDVEGRILIQPAGPVLVAGYSLDQVKARVVQALSRSLSGLITRPPTTFVDLTIARLRPVRAFMMGEVANPGTYSLSSFATVFNSLFSVGGPLVSGSLREVRVMRNGKLATKVDLYDYLIGSDKSNDIRINDNDVVYIPLRGRTVGIHGAVLRSAHFELLPGEQLKKLLEFSGGIRSTFYLQRVQINRIVPFAERKLGEPDRKIFDIDFSNILMNGKDYKLEDGDIVRVYPINDEQENYVDIAGAVWRPGRFQLEKVPTLKDLLVAADSLLPEAYMEHATIVRTYDDKETEVFYVNLDSIMNGTSKFPLESWDSVRVFSRYEMLANPDSIAVEGAAKHTGYFPLHIGLTLYDVVYENAGLSDTLYRQKIYLQRADLVRLNKDRYTSRIIEFNLWDLFQNRIKDTLLLPGDRIIIYPINAVQFTDRYVDIAGRVKSPGRYKLSENMTVLDLLIEAGGYTEAASTDRAEIARLERAGLGRDSLSRMINVPLPDFFDPQSLSSGKIAEYRAVSFKLQHRDQVFIRPNPKYIFQQSVTVDGEVEHPGSYVLSKLNEHVSDVIKRAGGVKNAGYAEGGKVVRGKLRLRINIAEAIDDPAGNNDIILQPGDSISIPKQPFSVQVSGEVNNPGLFSYVDGKSKSFYVKSSGGVTDSADFVLITYPTGMVEQAGIHWWSANPSIPDGSIITVAKVKPEPPEPIVPGQKTTAFDMVKDIFAIIVPAVTVIVLAAKL